MDFRSEYLGKWVDEETSVLRALKAYILRTEGKADSVVMRQVARDYGVTVGDMNKHWREVEVNYGTNQYVHQSK